MTALILVLAISTPSPALAYIDAGVGSMILQLLLGGIGGLLVVLKLYWHRIKRALPFVGHKQKPIPEFSKIPKDL